MMVRQPLWLAVGMTQADSVIAVVRPSDAESGDPDQAGRAVERQRAAVPARRRPGGTPSTVPVLPLPGRIRGRAAGPSLNAQAPTRPAGGGGASVVVAVADDEYGPTLFVASTARTWYR